jgi:hypothetical protein
MPSQSMTPGSSPLPGAFRSTMRWTPTGTAASGTSVRGPTVPLVSSSTSRPSASRACRRSTTAGCSSGSPPVTSTVRGPSSRTRASTASTADGSPPLKAWAESHHPQRTWQPVRRTSVQGRPLNCDSPQIDL